MQMKWLKLLLPCLLLSAAECGSHSLEFLSTGRVQPGDRPQFEDLTVFDGVPISYCDSLTQREKLNPSLESKDIPKHCNEARYNILESLQEIPASINGTVYVVQRRRGCILSANGIVYAFEAWAVNGMDFISFDPKAQRWTSRSPFAVKIKHRWNNKQPMNFAFRHFIKEQCPLMIQRIKLKSIPEKTELHVFAKSTDDPEQALLRCHVTTSDKSVNSVHLIGDGASKVSWISVNQPVPSEDGSVILRLTAGISLNQNTNKYGCSVQTGTKNITVFWDGSTLDGRNLLVESRISWKAVIFLFGVCCAVLMISIMICVTILMRKIDENRSRRRSKVDPNLEQLTRMVEELWTMRINSADQDFYDPEYFANQINGPDRCAISGN